MGVEVALIIAGISAIVGIAGAVASADAAAKSAAAQKEVKDITLAQGKVQTLESRRQKLREERIRRARIIAASENTGTGSSSGASGSVAALSTNLQGMVASASGQSKANEGINKQNQIAIDADQNARTIGAFTGAIQGGLSSFKTIFDS
jgi:flavin-dependent dehydrogenase